MKNLRKLRNQANLSTYKLANELNVTNATICNYENDKREPDIEMIIKIANYFNVTTDYLLGYEEKIIQEEKENNTQGKIKKYLTPEQDDWINLFNELNSKYGKEFTENITEALWKLTQTKGEN